MQIGSVVRLKSGGPLMTIVGNGFDGGYTCRWFAGDEVKEGNFIPESLELDED
ncbi:MAG: YodC family protein [Clostridium sp.]|uniref:YodC family protein n=1 Tax=Clostridium sp. TaxID=1506 RepID=UPI003EE6EB64